MKILVLGTGCANCRRVTAVLEEAVRRLGSDARVEKIEDILEIMKYDVMSLPAVVVDGEVVFSGGVPDAARAEEIVKAADRLED